MIQRPGAPAVTAARFHADGTGAVSQQRLVVLLYERLARDLDDAAAALEASDRSGSHRALLHAQEIVAELDRALDHDAWDGADGLSQLYRYLFDRLVQANVSQDRRAVADCAALVAPLLDAWTQAWSATSSGAGPSGAAPVVPVGGDGAPSLRLPDADRPGTTVPAARVPLDVSG